MGEKKVQSAIQPEIEMNRVMVACETAGKWIEVQVNGQALKYGMSQTVDCPCGKEQFVIGLRGRILNESDFQKAKARKD